MKRTTLAILISSLLILTALSVTGCGLNRAQDELAAEPVANPAVEPSVAADRENAREIELAKREEELGRLEADLDLRARELEARRVESEAPRNEAAPVVEPAAGPFPRRLESEPAPVARAVPVTVPASAQLEIELRVPLSSETSLPGDPVDAVVVSDLVQDGRIAVPAGSRLFGAVEEAVPQKKIGGQTLLAVRFDRIALPSGEQLDVSAGFSAEGKKQKSKDAATIGGAAAGGAVLGRVLSKNDRTKGTLIGAVLGGAIGTAIASQNNGDPVILEAGSVVDLFLDAPLQIAETAPAPATVAAAYR